jgi:hypothetical protein
MPGFFSTIRRMTLARGRESNKISLWVEPYHKEPDSCDLSDGLSAIQQAKIL